MGEVLQMALIVQRYSAVQCLEFLSLQEHLTIWDRSDIKDMLRDDVGVFLPCKVDMTSLVLWLFARYLQYIFDKSYVN